jgi:predicted peroxiredoxin
MAETNGNKVAIILQAGAEGHEGMARALHSLVYASELMEQGADVRLVFDGAGTQWLAQFLGAESPEVQGMGGLFGRLKERGLAYEVCDFCSGAFGVKESLQAEGEPLMGEYMDHPSIANVVSQGYQVWIL